ncbi:MAG: Ribonuclease BN [Candidatus Heimdallarchaeota archaeon LC_2]|nr:MAG: Ribonuclease BN [Candidatus Heimdallarchaeota archaeon LC_2]
MDIKINIYGVRGSAPISHENYMKFGGNTASLTIRTLENSLIFLDAGTGLKLAETQLDEIADKVFLLISHTHADHIAGFGMSKLSKLNLQKGYEKKKLQIIGPNEIRRSLSKYYDGDIIWPVKFDQSNEQMKTMNGIDYENIIEFSEDNQEIQIDSKTKITLMQGNHPVKHGVVLFKIEMQDLGNIVKIVYATDNEFDHIFNGVVNLEKDKFKSKYIKFVQTADILIAEAQYQKGNYDSMRGFGHSYPEQVIELANKANVKRLIITHHNLMQDDELEIIYQNAIDFAKKLNSNLIVEFAKEGTQIIFEEN